MRGLLGLMIAGVMVGCRAVPAPGPELQPARNVAVRDAQPWPDQAGPDPRGRHRDAHRHRGPSASDEPGDFDFYLLNLSWSPEFCTTHAESPECSRHLGLVLHGLWPQNRDGSYPQDCGDAPGPADPARYTDAFPTASLVQHEWTTHGTCSDLAADAYMEQARTAFREVKVPESLRAVRGEASMRPADLLLDLARANPAFPAGSFALTCGRNRLTAVEACLDRSLRPISCPAVHSCGATQIAVSAP